MDAGVAAGAPAVIPTWIRSTSRSTRATMSPSSSIPRACPRAPFSSGLTLGANPAIAQSGAGADRGRDPTCYGQMIGRAARPIAAGSWVREELLELPQAPPLDALIRHGRSGRFRRSPATRSRAFATPTAARHEETLASRPRCSGSDGDYVRRIKADPAAIPRGRRRGRNHACARMRSRHRRARRGDPDPHAAPHRPAREPGAPLVVSLGCEKLRPRGSSPERRNRRDPNDPHAG